MIDQLLGQERLTEAMRYLPQQGGKRIRPYLLIHTCLRYGGTMEQALPFAVALELIHSYSLIHDDLPCIDDDAVRRGAPAVHIAFDEATALLAGDALLNVAHTMMAKAVAEQTDPFVAHRLALAMEYISMKAGHRGMLLGEYLDTVNQGEMTIEALTNINRLKTSCLFQAALCGGALIACGDKKQYEQVGEQLGELFQMVDDMLDIIGDVECLGKPTGSDAARGMMTYPTLIGVTGTQQMIEAHHMALLKETEGDEFFPPFLAYLCERKH